MAGLSDSIELFIKELLDEDTKVEIKRNELAQYFGCAPSQINYVLATRFSADRGYLVESRRGGSGYVKVIRLSQNDADLFSLLCSRIGNSIDDDSAVSIIKRIYELGIITKKEARIMRSAVSCEAIALPISAKDVLRAGILKNTLAQAFKNLREE